MNKRKLEKSQRDHKFKRRRSNRILRKKLNDLIDKMNSEEIERTITYAKHVKVIEQLHQYFAAKIIQKIFRRYMVRKNN